MGSQYDDSDQVVAAAENPIEKDVNGVCKLGGDESDIEMIETSEREAMNGHQTVKTNGACVEHGGKLEVEVVKPPPYVKLRIPKTICLYLTFMAVGLATNLLGPTLTNMRVFLNTDTKTIVTAFSGSILGWIGGSVIAGIFYEQLNPEIQLSLAVLVMAIMTGIAPWTDSLLYFIMVMTTQGIGAGYIDAAGQPYGLSLWEGHPYKEPVMQATQLFLSIGCTAAPLLVSPFLIEITSTSNSTQLLNQSDLILNNTLRRPVFIINPVNDTGIIEEIVPDTLSPPLVGFNDSEYNNSTIYSRSDMIVPYSYIMFSMIILIIFFIFLAVYFVNGPGCRLKKSVRQAAKENVMHTPRKFLFALYALMFLFFFLLMWISGLGHLLPTFVVDGLGWDVTKGSIIAALFWGCLGLGRVVGIPLSTRWSPATMLVLDTGLAVVALFLMCLVPLVDDWLMWVAAAVAGFSTATEFVCIILWVSKYMKFTGVAAAVCICGMGIGGMAGVEITGYFFDKGKHMMMVYCSLGACMAHFLLFVFMYFFAEWYHKHLEEQKQIKQNLENKVREMTPLKDAEATEQKVESIA